MTKGREKRESESRGRSRRRDERDEPTELELAQELSDFRYQLIQSLLYELTEEFLPAARVRELVRRVADDARRDFVRLGRSERSLSAFDIMKPLLTVEADVYGQDDERERDE